MDREIRKKLAVAASWLPMCFKPVADHIPGVSGFALINKKITIDWDKKPINAMLNYHPVNHLHELEKVYKNRNMTGVEQYLNKYKDEIDAAIAEHNQKKNKTDEKPTKTIALGSVFHK